MLEARWPWRHVCDVLLMKTPAWLASMVWTGDFGETCPSRQAERCLRRTTLNTDLSVLKVDRGTWSLTMLMLLPCVTRPAECWEVIYLVESLKENDHKILYINPAVIGTCGGQSPQSRPNFPVRPVHYWKWSDLCFWVSSKKSVCSPPKQPNFHGSLAMSRWRKQPQALLVQDRSLYARGHGDEGRHGKSPCPIRCLSETAWVVDSSGGLVGSLRHGWTDVSNIYKLFLLNPPWMTIPTTLW